MKCKTPLFIAAILAISFSSIVHAGQMFSYGAGFINCTTEQNSQITPARGLQGLNPSDPGEFLYECLAIATTGGAEPDFEQRHVKVFASGAQHIGLVYAVFGGVDNNTGTLVHRLEFIPDTFHCTVFSNTQSCPDGNGNHVTIQGPASLPDKLIIISR